MKSYVQGKWQAGSDRGTLLCDATTGHVVAQASSQGIDFRGVLEHARKVGGPALQRLTFHERAALLKKLAEHLTKHKESLYALSYATGATRGDATFDIDAGIGVLRAYASKGVREMPNSSVYVETPPGTGGVTGQRIHVSLGGAAVHINAFNLPVCGTLEKLAPTLLAGMPAIVKPATATSYLTQLAVRLVVESGILPEGALQLVCGDLGDLLDHLRSADVIAFTGSAATASCLGRHPAIIRHAVRFTAQTESLNASILGPDAVPGTAEFDLFVHHVVRDITVKAGQQCTAIRRALVPAPLTSDVTEALRVELGKVVIGDPRQEEVTMGPVATFEQRRAIIGQLEKLAHEAYVFKEEVENTELLCADAERGAFVPPALLLCKDVESARAVHMVEAFGPVCTVLPYRNLDDATELARRGGTSLVGSVFTADDGVAAELVLGLASSHNRIFVANRHLAEDLMESGSQAAPVGNGSTGSGGAEGKCCIHAALGYMQSVDVQGSPELLTCLTGCWMAGSLERDPGVHPFKKSFHTLAIGDTFRSGEREITVEDIERFAALTGDRFYAHMDDAQAARNPMLGGRVAHGFFLVSAAAGLFVDPPFGPVLANYGVDRLRFTKPVKPGERIKVRLTCKQKSLRRNTGYGEVRWDTEITNHAGELVAAYDLLTMVSEAG